LDAPLFLSGSRDRQDKEAIPKIARAFHVRGLGMGRVEMVE